MKQTVLTAEEFFKANGGIKNKATRELVMLLDSETLSGTGFVLVIGKCGRITIQEAPYIKEWRRIVRLSIKRKRLAR